MYVHILKRSFRSFFLYLQRFDVDATGDTADVEKVLF